VAAVQAGWVTNRLGVASRHGWHTRNDANPGAAVVAARFRLAPDLDPVKPSAWGAARGSEPAYGSPWPVRGDPWAKALPPARLAGSASWLGSRLT
jgi:hypothetical protein